MGTFKIAAVEEEPRPSAVGSMSPGAVELVDEEAFDRFRRHVSVEAAVFNSELLCHRVGQFFFRELFHPEATTTSAQGSR